MPSEDDYTFRCLINHNRSAVLSDPQKFQTTLNEFIELVFVSSKWVRGVYDDAIDAVAITLAMPVPGQPRVMNSMTWADVAILLLLLLLLLLLRSPAKIKVHV